MAATLRQLRGHSGLAGSRKNDQNRGRRAGHSPGSVAFYHAAGGFIIGGDLLFQLSVGRTDLPGGDFDTLANSIRTQFYTLPDETKVYSGHGPVTTIGYEKRNNPFVSQS